jgi:two-component system sensor histidine kinase YesM
LKEVDNYNAFKASIWYTKTMNTKRIKRNILNSITTKLAFVLIVFTCVPLVIMTTFSINDSKKQMENIIINTNVSQMHWVGVDGEEKITSLNNIMFSLMADQQIAEYSKEDTISDDMILQMQKYIFNEILSTYSGNIDLIKSVSVSLKNVNKSFVLYNEQPKITSSTLDINDENKYTTLYTYNPSDFSMIRSINDFNTHEILGAVSIDADWKVFDSIIGSLKDNPESNVLIMGKDGSVYYNPFNAVISDDMRRQISEMSSQEKPTVYENIDSQYVFIEPLNSDYLVFVKIVPQSLVLKGIEENIIFLLFVILGLLLLIVIASFSLAKKLTAPVLHLVDEVSSFFYDNDMYKDLHLDEIDTLQMQFIDIIKSQYKMQMNTKNAQIKALQAQINPHFLQNTLQAIGGIAIMRDVPEIYEVITALSNNIWYAHNGNKTHDLVTIEKELEAVNNYLLIQKFRFKDKIQTQIEVDPDLEDCLIPFFVLQPIAENSFEHGFIKKSGECNLHIKIQKHGNDIKFTVEDDGVGISESEERKIQNIFNLEPADIINMEDSFALANIQARVVARYDKPYGVSIVKSDVSGTIIELLLPYIKGGESI